MQSQKTAAKRRQRHQRSALSAPQAWRAHHRLLHAPLPSKRRRSCFGARATALWAGSPHPCAATPAAAPRPRRRCRPSPPRRRRRAACRRRARGCRRAQTAGSAGRRGRPRWRPPRGRRRRGRGRAPGRGGRAARRRLCGCVLELGFRGGGVHQARAVEAPMLCAAAEERRCGSGSSGGGAACQHRRCCCAHAKNAPALPPVSTSSSDPSISAEYMGLSQINVHG